jgi:catechol 2,3-dioxygenase-like lactoylglutathione lyase family enzyme
MNMHVLDLSAARERRRMTMKQRISLITLGVDDVAGSADFYSRLGFRKAKEGNEDVAFFQLAGGLVLSLYRRAHLFRDAGIEDKGSSFGGVTLAYNTSSELEVDKLAAAFVGAGGHLLKAPHKVFWGGYIAYAADPDGHVWEIAHNPGWELDESGGLNLPE